MDPLRLQKTDPLYLIRNIGKINQASENLEFHEAFSEFELKDLQNLLSGFLYFEKFAERLNQAVKNRQLVWVLQKELFFSLNSTSMHSKLFRVYELLRRDQPHEKEINTLHKGN